MSLKREQKKVDVNREVRAKLSGWFLDSLVWTETFEAPLPQLNSVM